MLGAVYLLFLTGGDGGLMVAVLTIFWGVLAGINANINQFWLSHAAPEAPDFANGLFLTAVNLGTMAATTVSGMFIDSFGTKFVIYGGLLFLAAAALLFGAMSEAPYESGHRNRCIINADIIKNMTRHNINIFVML